MLNGKINLREKQFQPCDAHGEQPRPSDVPGSAWAELPELRVHVQSKGEIPPGSRVACGAACAPCHCIINSSFLVRK